MGRTEECRSAGWLAQNQCRVRDGSASWGLSRKMCVAAGTTKGGTCSIRGTLQATSWDDSLSLTCRYEPHFIDDDDEWAEDAAYYTSFLIPFKDLCF